MEDNASESRELLSVLSAMPGPDPETIDRIYQRTLIGAGVIAGTALTASEGVAGAGQAAAVTSAGAGKAASVAGIVGSVSLKTKLIIGLAMLASAGGGYGVRSLTEPTQAPPARIVSAGDTAIQSVPVQSPVILTVPSETAKALHVAGSESAVPIAAETLSEPVTPKSRIESPRASPQRHRVPEPNLAEASRPADFVARLSRERALLDSVRRGLRDSDLAGAASAIERHAEEFRSGSLREERETLWVTLLLRRNDLHGAQKRARQFELLFPTSLHLPRMKLELARAMKERP
ncbi:MAG: hypothetical protein GY811_02665 [Myxococcales bacterium]|nr:hypothetical protein [Myxococcales bacterium]